MSHQLVHAPSLPTNRVFRPSLSTCVLCCAEGGAVMSAPGDATQYRCRSCALVKCKSCEKEKPLADFSETIQKNHRDHWRCLECHYPVCTRRGCEEHRCKKEGPFEGDRRRIKGPYSYMVVSLTEFVVKPTHRPTLMLFVCLLSQK